MGYSDLLVENRGIFIPHLYLVLLQGVMPSEFRKMFDADKTRMIELLM